MGVVAGRVVVGAAQVVQPGPDALVGQLPQRQLPVGVQAVVVGVARVPGQSPGGGQAPVGSAQEALDGGLARAVVRALPGGADHGDGHVHALGAHLVQAQEHRPVPGPQARAVAGGGVVALDDVGGPGPSGPAAQAVGAQQAQVDARPPVRAVHLHAHPDGPGVGRDLEGEGGVAVRGLVGLGEAHGCAPQDGHRRSSSSGAPAAGRRRVMIAEAGAVRDQGSTPASRRAPVRSVRSHRPRIRARSGSAW